jgi:hypothetical protein
MLLPSLNHEFHRYPVIANGQVPVDEWGSIQWQPEGDYFLKLNWVFSC